jgi:hypothetical protein
MINRLPSTPVASACCIGPDSHARCLTPGILPNQANRANHPVFREVRQGYKKQSQRRYPTWFEPFAGEKGMVSSANATSGDLALNRKPAKAATDNARLPIRAGTKPNKATSTKHHGTYRIAGKPEKQSHLAYLMLFQWFRKEKATVWASNERFCPAH